MAMPVGHVVRRRRRLRRLLREPQQGLKQGKKSEATQSQESGFHFSTPSFKSRWLRRLQSNPTGRTMADPEQMARCH
jgi:hypothetical protein